MEIISGPIERMSVDLIHVTLHADRSTLAKRRWRGTADDGREFGFDLETPLRDGDPFFADDERAYRVAQEPETLCALRLGDRGLRTDRSVARIAWHFGNLHFPIEIGPDMLWVVDDPAVRQLLERLKIAFETVERIFNPLLAVEHSHH